MPAPTPDNSILGILAAKPQHGYQLLEHFTDPEKLGRVWSMSTSQIYAVLKRLEAQGLVAGEIVVVKDAPARTEYTLTLEGHQKLGEWLHDPKPAPSIRRVRIELLSKIYVAGLLGTPAEPIIRYQLDACLRLQQEIQQPAGSQSPTTTDSLLSEFVSGQLGAAIAWLESLLELFSEGNSNE